MTDTSIQQCISHLRDIAHQLQAYQIAQEATSAFNMPSAARLPRIGEDLYHQIDVLVSLLKDEVSK